MAEGVHAKEVINMLGQITDAPLLEEIAQDIGMPNIEVVRGNVGRLYKKLSCTSTQMSLRH